MTISVITEFVIFRSLVSLLCVLGGLCVSTTAQDFKTVHDGVEYAEVTRKLGDDPVKINLLRLDLKKVRLDVHHALDAAIGTETTSSIVARHGAVAAINAGFFRLDSSIFAGDAAGLLIIDRQLWSENVDSRIALAISNGSETATAFVNIETVEIVKSKRWMHAISGINRERKTDEFVKFTFGFHRTTLTNSDGLEIVVRRGKIVEIRDRQVSAVIPEDGFVLSASGKFRDELLLSVQLGAKVTSKMGPVLYGAHFPTDDDLRNVNAFNSSEDIVGGVPQLIKNGKIDITWEQEKASKSFVETRHPRTAVAKMKDGKFLMITVDGRQPGVSVGMNLNELAAYLLEIGAMDAMNLDGGGSTTMFLDGKVVNTPSGYGVERKVGDAIVVTLWKKK